MGIVIDAYSSMIVWGNPRLSGPKMNASPCEYVKLE
jgi:hypothetical protein